MLEKLPDAVGHALRNVRAGLDHIAFNMIDLRAGTAAITVTSLAFNDHGPIPARYTADGEGISPPLSWSGIPTQAESLLLLVEDADAPTPHPLVHAIVAGIAPHDGALPEGGIDPDRVDGAADDRTVDDEPPDAGAAADHVRIGRNSYLQAGWLPPDPPPGHGVHRYAFQVFALGPGDDLPSTPGRDAVLDAIRNRGIASGFLIGTFERPDGSIKIDAQEPVAVTAPAGLTAA